jgi:outer membrane protein TolC
MVSLSDDVSGFFGRIFKRAPKEASDETPTRVVPSPAKLIPWMILPLAAGLWASPVQAQELVTLDQAISSAEANNLDLKILEEQVFQAETMVPMAWGTLTPRVIAGGNWTRNQNEIELDFPLDDLVFLPSTLEPIFLATHQDPTEQAIIESVFDEVAAEEAAALEAADEAEPILIQQLSYFDANISVVQPLFNPVAVAGLRGSYQNRDAARSDADRARMQIRAAVTQSYYALVVARESQRIAADSVANARDHLAVARRQVDAGAVPSIVGLQAELALARAERMLLDTDSQILSAEQAFARLTGLDPKVQVQMPETMSSPVQNLDQAMGFVESRADVLAADNRVEVANFQKRADQLGWLPTVDSRFTYSWTENEGFQGQPTFWMFTVSANWTLWDGGYRLQTNRQYASQLRMADYASQKARLDAQDEIQLAWQRYERAEEAFQAVELELSLATENLRLSETGFQAGSVTWLEVSDAQLQLDQARIGLLSERMARDMAALDLAVATGLY